MKKLWKVLGLGLMWAIAFPIGAVAGVGVACILAPMIYFYGFRVVYEVSRECTARWAEDLRRMSRGGAAQVPGEGSLGIKTKPETAKPAGWRN